jgi:hypothetical protein
MSSNEPLQQDLVKRKIFNWSMVIDIDRVCIQSTVVSKHTLSIDLNYNDRRIRALLQGLHLGQLTTKETIVR